MVTEDRGSTDSVPFPERVGRYELLLPIASGGMATVYLARSTGLGGFEREVALKLTHGHLREQAGFAVALMDEAQLAGRIRHQNVVAVLDVGEDPHGVYLVMEYVEGETLAGLARIADEAETRIPESIVIRVIDDALAGLHVAHELRDATGVLVDLVHRDVTPHNILVGVDGVAKLADFGVAKATSRFGMTATGLIKGKVAYMSPEQALGQPLDRRCDVWAAGVVLWELLSGMRLHATSSDAATLLRIVTRAPPRLGTVRPDVPPEVDEVVARALAMDRSRRYATAEDLARALEAAAVPVWGRAERREVGAYVDAVVADRLQRRRKKIDEVFELRGRLSSITRGALPSRPGTPSALEPLAAPSESPTVVEGTPSASEAATAEWQPGSTDGGAPSVRWTSSPGTGDAPPEPTQTDTISVSTAGSPARRGLVRGRWPMLVAVATLAAGVAATVVVTRGERAPTASLPGSTPSRSPSAEGGAGPAAVSPDELPLALAADDDERVLALAADVPIVAVEIGDRHVDFLRVEREQTVSVTPRDEGATVTVFGRNGRYGIAKLEATTKRIRVELGAARRRKPRPAATGGLLTNPYGTKP